MDAASPTPWHPGAFQRRNRGRYPLDPATPHRPLGITLRACPSKKALLRPKDGKDDGNGSGGGEDPAFEAPASPPRRGPLPRGPVDPCGPLPGAPSPNQRKGIRGDDAFENCGTRGRVPAAKGPSVPPSSKGSPFAEATQGTCPVGNPLERARLPRRLPSRLPRGPSAALRAERRGGLCYRTFVRATTSATISVTKIWLYILLFLLSYRNVTQVTRQIEKDTRTRMRLR